MSRPCQAILALGLVNLLGGLVFGLADTVPTTRSVIDVVYANFAMAVWAVVIVAAGEVPGRQGWQLAAKAVAVVGLALAMFALAGAVGAAYQLGRGQAGVEWAVYGHGLFFNLGWNACHLAALAVFLHSVTAARWLAAATTVAAYATVNLAFDAELARFGAPINPFSDIGGYGARFVPHLALGVYWTGFCIALLVGAHLVNSRSRPTANAVAWGWGGLVVWLVSGCWIAFRPVAAEVTPSSLADMPQPVYSRIDLQVEMQPAEGWLRSRGSVVLVNNHDVAIADLHFRLPPALAVEAISLTGEPLAGDGTTVASFRLNRPLEPRETLKVGFDLRSPVGLRVDGVVRNGTVLHMSDVLPTLAGGADPQAFFEQAPPTAFSVRLGTSLDQIAVAPGRLTREWKENGTRFFEYRTDAPIRPLATLHSGRYAAARADIAGAPIEIYYHPAHAFAVDAMGAHARTRLARLREDLPRPVRVVEVPDWRHAVRPPGVLGLNWRRAADDSDRRSYAGVLSFSEWRGH